MSKAKSDSPLLFEAPLASGVYFSKDHDCAYLKLEVPGEFGRLLAGRVGEFEGRTFIVRIDAAAATPQR